MSEGRGMDPHYLDYAWALFLLALLGGACWQGARLVGRLLKQLGGLGRISDPGQVLKMAGEILPGVRVPRGYRASRAVNILLVRIVELSPVEDPGQPRFILVSAPDVVDRPQDGQLDFELLDLARLEDIHNPACLAAAPPGSQRRESLELLTLEGRRLEAVRVVQESPGQREAVLLRFRDGRGHQVLVLAVGPLGLDPQAVTDFLEPLDYSILRPQNLTSIPRPATTT